MYSGVTKIKEALSKMRELVLSWNLKEAVDFAKTEEGLKALSELLTDRNPRVRLRALSVLSGVLEEIDSGKGRLVELFFDPLIHLLNSGDERACVRALPVLKRLIEGSHLQLSEFGRLVSALFSIAEECDGMAWNEAVEILKVTPIAVMPEGIGPVVRDYILSGNVRTATLGAYILVQEGDSLEGISEEVLAVLGRALRCGDPTTVELALMTVRELLRVPPTYPVDTVLLGLVPYLRSLSEEGENVKIRQEAKTVLNTLLDTLRDYYQKNPWELERSLRHLVRGERKEDAILIASLMGDPSILLAVEGGTNFSGGSGKELGTMGGREL